jgi:hypothetical protein
MPMVQPGLTHDKLVLRIENDKVRVVAGRDSAFMKLATCEFGRPFGHPTHYVG